MRISLNWLREFVDIPDNVPVLSEKLSMAGFAVDGVEPSGDDSILELDVTTNRGDCLSHFGIAREVATIYGGQAHLPKIEVVESAPRADSAFSISIADDDLCQRYCGRYIEGVTIERSPKWLAQRIESVGIRSVNNVADITNYVLMELGQPLHAFDADSLVDHQIVVRRAAIDEKITTLDGQNRVLDPSMLVIADAGRAVALAGIMGGEETEISDSTRNVLLESAWFDLLSIRKTARRFGASTEASYRFERGADIEMALTACDRAAQLIQEIAGGKVYTGVIDVYPVRIQQPKVRLRRHRIEQYLGMAVSDTEVTRIFTGLDFAVETDPEGWTLEVPTHRHDVSREEDLLEEVARIHGYDRFPSTLPSWTGQGQRLPWHAEEQQIRSTLTGMGFAETCTIAFSDQATEGQFEPDLEPVRVRNPLSEEAPILRTSLVPSMLRSLEWNMNRGSRDLALYEIAKVYSEAGEYRQLILAHTGARELTSVHRSAVEADFYSLKGRVEALLESFAVDTAASAEDLPNFYHPGRSMRMGAVARLGELDPSIGERFRLRQKAYVAEIDLQLLYDKGLRNVAAKTIPKYPAIRRDLSLLVDRKLRYADVLLAVQGARIRELVQIEPFDRLDTGPFPVTCYSLAIGLVYQSTERTLTEVEVETFQAKVLDQLGTIGIELRS